ncbi:hypothetical protein [Halorubellus sp. PRR65]|uniref:DUF7521 family protein n=1 Tax=Halorubellus sp. PRR65 TaxID=3098148 RepID=UPI002B25D58A|nr:hypothetical protein [Halorubellus sp. PRR65]
MTYVYGFSLVELAVIAAAGASTLVGLYIGYQAYRALELYDDRSMFYLAVGLILLTAVTYSTAFAGTLAFRLELLALPAQDAFRLVVRLCQLAGLLCIAYSLSRRR